MAESELIKEEYPITVFHASDQTPEEHWLTSDVTKRWTDNPQGVSLKYPYEFVCSRVYTYKDNVNSNTPASQKKGWKDWDVKNIALSLKKSFVFLLIKLNNTFILVTSL